MTSREKKEIAIHDLAERFSRKKIAIFTDFHGISVEKSRLLRRILKKNGAEYKVAKKTLLGLAMKKSVIQGLDVKKDLKGEIAVMFGYGDDIAAPAKDLLQFSKENETFRILAGILKQRFLSPKEIETLSRLPSREILLALLLKTLQSPLRGLAAVLEGNIRNLVVVLSRIKNKKHE
jgi:large subunit ribosomal protein L10